MTINEKALHVSRILCDTYGAPFPFFSDNDPLSELVGTLLSHRTKNERTSQAFANLREQFPTWRDLMEGDTEAVVQAIYVVTFPGQKARRIQQALRLIEEANAGELSLDFLKDMPPLEARKWLQTIPGVGAKTSAAVLNFSTLRIPALVVDSHHHRVAERLGLVPAGSTLAKTQKILEAQLPGDWDAQQVYDNHEALMYHGQKCCFPRKPNCGGCTVREWCERRGREGG